MSITAIVTNHDYARYLPRCLESATTYCDEVLVYDDGSTDDSLGVIRGYGLDCVHRDDASGSPVWGSNLGIEAAKTSHLLFLDADNYLVAPPPVRDVDYTFAPIIIVNDDEVMTDFWQYPDWPLEAGACMEKFKRDLGMPFPWGGVWRADFLKDKRWTHWPSTQFAADFRTALEWCSAGPTLAYSIEPFLAFRMHAGQWSASPERDVMLKDAREFAAGIKLS